MFFKENLKNAGNEIKRPFICADCEIENESKNIDEITMTAITIDKISRIVLFIDIFRDSSHPIKTTVLQYEINANMADGTIFGGNSFISSSNSRLSKTLD